MNQSLRDQFDVPINHLLEVIVPHLSVDSAYRLASLYSQVRTIIDRRLYWHHLLVRDLHLFPKKIETYNKDELKRYYLRRMNYPIGMKTILVDAEDEYLQHGEIINANNEITHLNDYFQVIRGNTIKGINDQPIDFRNIVAFVAPALKQRTTIRTIAENSPMSLVVTVTGQLFQYYKREWRWVREIDPVVDSINFHHLSYPEEFYLLTLSRIGEVHAYKYHQQQDRWFPVPISNQFTRYVQMCGPYLLTADGVVYRMDMFDNNRVYFPTPYKIGEDLDLVLPANSINELGYRGLSNSEEYFLPSMTKCRSVNWGTLDPTYFSQRTHTVNILDGVRPLNDGLYRSL